MKTYMANAQTVSKQWLLIDAAGKTLGRLASEVAFRLRGKHKPDFTPHVDGGDYIIIINASKLTVTGNKRENKEYFRHSGHPGKLKIATFADLQARHPERVLMLAVKNMLPKGPLGRKVLRNLKIYSDNEHPHAAQQPITIDL